MKKQSGKHLIADIHDVDFSNIKFLKQEEMENIFLGIFKKYNFKCLGIKTHFFNNIGSFTSIFLLAESHLSIHTWPENNYIAMDIFLCKSYSDDMLNNCFNDIVKKLKLKNIKIKKQIINR